MLEPISGPASPAAGAEGVAPRSYVAAAEVDTEFEDDGDEVNLPSPTAPEQKVATGAADEVEEELESTAADPDDANLGEGDEQEYYQESLGSQSRPTSSAAGSARGGGGGRAASSASGDYAVPSANKEVWKQFGCNTEAGRALRRLYQNGSNREAAGRVAYPRLQSPSQRWEPKAAPRKACPQRAPVRVPRAAGPKYDPDDPKNWHIPAPCRKPASQIMAEMEADVPQIPTNLPAGRNQAAEKNNLQNRFQFCGGRAMPKGAMGHVEGTADLPKVEESSRQRLEARRMKDENGMNAEEREIFEELTLAIKRKQERLREIDEEDAANPKLGPAKTARNKEALELRNDIDRTLADIDRLLELAG